MSTNTNTDANLKAAIGRLLDRIDALEAELSEYRAENERDKATIRQQVTETAENNKRDSNIPISPDEPQGKSGQNRSKKSSLPIEQLAAIENSDEYHTSVTESVERAVTIFEHFEAWSSKAPAGRVIRDNLRTLLNTATGDRLAWRQVYRACEKLEEWSKGAIEFTKHARYGWILVAGSDGRSSSVAGRRTASD